MVITAPGFIISFDSSKPDPKAMALGGVLIGNAMAVEQTIAMGITNIKISKSVETAIGIKRLAVAVLLINVVIKAVKHRKATSTHR